MDYWSSYSLLLNSHLDVCFPLILSFFPEVRHGSRTPSRSKTYSESCFFHTSVRKKTFWLGISWISNFMDLGSKGFQLDQNQCSSKNMWNAWQKNHPDVKYNHFSMELMVRFTTPVAYHSPICLHRSILPSHDDWISLCSVWNMFFFHENLPFTSVIWYHSTE